MAKVELDSFDLESYFELSTIHKDVIFNLGIDNNTKKYLGDLNYLITRVRQRRNDNFIDEIYIVFNKEEISLGIMSLSIIDDKFEVSIGILPKYRGLHLASKMLGEFTNYIFSKYPNIDKIYGQINSANEASIKGAISAGFQREQTNLYSISRNK